jgi:hypothetical protein
MTRSTMSSRGFRLRSYWEGINSLRTTSRSIWSWRDDLQSESPYYVDLPAAYLAPAPLNSVVPVPHDRLARSRRNCTASQSLTGCSAVLRIESFPPSPFQLQVGRAAGKDGTGFPNLALTRPGRWHAGAKGVSDAKYKCHPQEVTTRLTRNRKRPINASERVIYFTRDEGARRGRGRHVEASRVTRS